MKKYAEPIKSDVAYIKSNELKEFDHTLSQASSSNKNDKNKCEFKLLKRNFYVVE